MPLTALAPQTRKACVMGWPISHSLSPRMHTRWLKQYGIDGTYEAKPVTAATLKDALAMLIDNGYAGCNLTSPLKEESLPLMDTLDDTALQAGAVNTVVIKGGRLKGYNSDGFGFVENLKYTQPRWSGEKVVVIGAGGAARGIIANLVTAGAKHFTLINRTPDRAEKLVESLKLKADIVAWADRDAALKDATLLINTSCLGMDGQEALDLDLAALPVDAVVSDIIYHPLHTPLISGAIVRGNPVVEGIGMLIHQGRLGFRLWFDRDPEVTPDMYAYLKDEIE